MLGNPCFSYFACQVATRSEVGLLTGTVRAVNSENCVCKNCSCRGVTSCKPIMSGSAFRKTSAYGSLRSSHVGTPGGLRKSAEMLEVIMLIFIFSSDVIPILPAAQRLALPAAGEKQLTKRKTVKAQNRLQKRADSQPSGAPWNDRTIICHERTPCCLDIG